MEKPYVNKSKKHKFVGIVAIVAFVILFGAFSPLADSVSAMFSDAHVVALLWRVRNEIMLKSPAGQYYEAMFWKHSSEQVQILDNYPEHDEELWRLTRMFVPGLEALLDGKGDTVRITEEQIKGMQAELDWYASVGGLSLRDDIEREQQRFPLENFVGMTMSEALDYINSNWPPELTAESIAPTEVATQTPQPMPTLICVSGFDPNCLAKPSLVSNSNGQWVYYVWNGVYFEYPSTWHVEQWDFEPFAGFSIVPTSDAPEASGMVTVQLWAGHLPIEIENVEQKDLLTLFQKAIGRSFTPTWERYVSLPDFEGVEFLWEDQNTTSTNLEVILYAENDQIVVGLYIPVIDNQIPELIDRKSRLIDNPNAVNEIFPNFQHITESLRIWK